MTATMRQGLALYLALGLMILTPFQGIGLVRAEVGVKTIVLGGALGVGALVGLKMMMGSASAVGAVGAAGTGVVGAVGGAVGGVMSGISSLFSTLATGAASLFSSAGAMLSSGFSSIVSVVSQPWFYIPAALIAGGLLVYHFYKKAHPAGGGVPDSRTFARPMSFLDRFRSGARSLVYGTAGGWGTMRPLPPAPYSNGFYAGMNNFYGGGQLAMAGSGAVSLGGAATALPVTPMGDPAPAGIEASMDLRANLQPSAPLTDEALRADIASAEAARRAAYDRLVEAMRSKPRGSETAGVASSDGVLEAIRDYKLAHQQAESLRERLAKP